MMLQNNPSNASLETAAATPVASQGMKSKKLMVPAPASTPGNCSSVSPSEDEGGVWDLERGEKGADLESRADGLGVVLKGLPLKQPPIALLNIMFANDLLLQNEEYMKLVHEGIENTPDKPEDFAQTEGSLEIYEKNVEAFLGRMQKEADRWGPEDNLPPQQAWLTRFGHLRIGVGSPDSGKDKAEPKPLGLEAGFEEGSLGAEKKNLDASSALEPEIDFPAAESYFDPKSPFWTPELLTGFWTGFAKKNPTPMDIMKVEPHPLVRRTLSFYLMSHPHPNPKLKNLAHCFCCFRDRRVLNLYAQIMTKPGLRTSPWHHKQLRVGLSRNATLADAENVHKKSESARLKVFWFNKPMGALREFYDITNVVWARALAEQKRNGQANVANPGQRPDNHFKSGGGILANAMMSASTASQSASLNKKSQRKGGGRHPEDFGFKGLGSSMGKGGQAQQQAMYQNMYMYQQQAAAAHAAALSMSGRIQANPMASMSMASSYGGGKFPGTPGLHPYYPQPQQLSTGYPSAASASYSNVSGSVHHADPLAESWAGAGLGYASMYPHMSYGANAGLVEPPALAGYESVSRSPPGLFPSDSLPRAESQGKGGLDPCDPIYYDASDVALAAAAAEVHRAPPGL